MNVIPSAQRSIETLALSIAFGEGRQRRQVVDNVNILLGQGESYGLIGESGCGKSTLLRALAGLNHHYQGHISCLTTASSSTGATKASTGMSRWCSKIPMPRYIRAK